MYYWVLLAAVILSFIPRLPEGMRFIADFVRAVTEPVLRLVRPLIPPIRVGAVAFDLSILIVFFALSVLRGAVCRSFF